jgi:3-hydroxyisobutyrate dehydrogenase
MSVSSARCWSVDTYNPIPGYTPNAPAGRQYEGGFACDLMLKDLRLAL